MVEREAEGLRLAWRARDVRRTPKGACGTREGGTEGAAPSKRRQSRKRK